MANRDLELNTGTNLMSSHKFIAEFSIINQSDIGQVTFIRDFAPRTFALIRFKLRNNIQSRVVVREGEINIPFKIGRAGPENTKRDVKRGDMAYWTQSNILIIFLKNKIVDYPVNIVGSVDKRFITFFDKLKLGNSIKLSLIESAIDEADYL